MKKILIIFIFNIFLYLGVSVNQTNLFFLNAASNEGGISLNRCSFDNCQNIDVMLSKGHYSFDEKIIINIFSNSLV